jgi:hypothetical protein
MTLVLIMPDRVDLFQEWRAVKKSSKHGCALKFVGNCWCVQNDEGGIAEKERAGVRYLG